MASSPQCCGLRVLIRNAVRDYARTCQMSRHFRRWSGGLCATEALLVLVPVLLYVRSAPEGIVLTALYSLFDIATRWSYSPCLS